MSEIATLAGFAQRLADAVRPRVLDVFRKSGGYDVKADKSPVTAADRAAEATMRAMIRQHYPSHGILGEEEGPERTDQPFVWVLDPIDGTKSFVTGKPLFGTLIALVHDGQPIVGVIDAPAMNERWIGAEGLASTHNGREVRTRACARLAAAWLYATSPQMFRGPDAEAFGRLREACYAAVYGADCYAYGLLACGWVDFVCEASLQPYDYCALVPIIAGAGGVITDWEGEPLGLYSDGRVLAAGDPTVHALARRVLAS